jgi:hypothetical protein
MGSPLIFVEEIRLRPWSAAASCYINQTTVIRPHVLETTSTSTRGLHTRPAQKVSSHLEYLKNRSCGLDVTWQPVTGGLSSLLCGTAEIPPSAMQLFESKCAKPRFCFPVNLQRHSTTDGMRPLLAKGGIMGEKWPIKFSLTM